MDLHETELIKVILKSGETGWVVYCLGSKLSNLQQGDFVRILRNLGDRKLFTGQVLEIIATFKVSSHEK